jgi:hypothetical protein
VWVRTSSVRLGEENILRAAENRVLRNMFGPKRFEVTGGGKCAQKEPPQFVIFTSILKMIQIKEDVRGEVSDAQGSLRNTRRMLVGKLDGKVPLGRSS